MDQEYISAMQAGFEDELEKIGESAQERLLYAQQEAKLEPAFQQYLNTKTHGQKLRETLSTIGGGVTGAGLGAGVGALGAMGLRGLGVPITPSAGAHVGGGLGGGLGLGIGAILGDSHGQSDVDLGRAYERYGKLEDKAYGGGQGPARKAQRISTHGDK